MQESSISFEIPKVHDWWANLENERYWLEATDRKDLGVNLIAPVSENAGQRLVAHVQQGDIVFHYFLPVRAIVALSVASGLPYLSKLRWPDREQSPEAIAYCIDLVNFTSLEQPIPLSDFRSYDFEIRKIKQEIESSFGKPTYFPFQLRKNVDPAQSYLSKFPRALVDIFPQINDEMIENLTPELVSNFKQAIRPTLQNKSNRPSGKWGRHIDDKKKRAIEKHAMKLAEEYLTDLGFKCEDVSSQKSLGYDIRAIRGQEIVGVEVKGSSIPRIQIELQLSEVEFARIAAPPIHSLLFVVDEIECEGTEHPYATFGGKVRKWWDWNPEQLALTPTQFRYTLPEKTRNSPNDLDA